MLAQEPRYPNSGTDGHATLLAAWKGVCYVTECAGGEIVKRGKENVNGDPIPSPLSD